MKIELFPKLGKDTSEIRSFLSSIILNAKSLKAGVAFKSLGATDISPGLVSLLSKDESFLCVDFHLPTDIGKLTALKNAGANVYIFLGKIIREIEVKGEAQNMLHPKMLLFDLLSEGEANLWIGSHNWTYSALVAGNIEASAKISLSTEDQLYTDAAEYLLELKSLCEEYDVKKEQEYLDLQDEAAGRTTAVIYLRGDRVDSLAGTAVSIFSSLPNDYSEIAKATKVYVAIIENRSGMWSYYKASRLHIGKLSQMNSRAGGVGLDQRRYAYRDSPAIPELLPAKPVPVQVINNSAFFVTLDILRDETKKVWFKEPIKKAEKWVIDKDGSEKLAKLFGQDAVRKHKIKLLVPGPKITKAFEESEREILQKKDIKFIERKVKMQR